MIIWTELDANNCEIVEDAGESIKIKHPNSGRAKYFTKSRTGKWYWIGPRIDSHGTKEGFVITGKLGR